MQLLKISIWKVLVLVKFIPFREAPWEIGQEEQRLIKKRRLSLQKRPVPPHQDSQENSSFQWQEKLCQFHCLRFGLSSVPRVFTKLAKVPISILRRLNVVLVPGAKLQVGRRGGLPCHFLRIGKKCLSFGKKMPWLCLCMG